MIWNEPVRGTVVDRSLSSLAGIDRARAMLRLDVPAPPISRLTGISTTQVGAGSVTCTQPASPWLGNGETLDVSMLIQGALTMATLTSLPPGSESVPVTLSIHHLRPCTLEGRSFIARARVINTGPRYTLVDALVEDALGRAVAQGTGTQLARALDPPPAPWTGVDPVAEPTYRTPDPYLREHDATPLNEARLTSDVVSIVRRIAAGELPDFPICQLIGARLSDPEPGGIVMWLRTSDWLRELSATTVSSGVVAVLGHFLTSGAASTLAPLDHQVGVLDYSATFLRPAAADGRDLVGRAAVTHEADDLLVANGELVDADGAVVALFRQTNILITRRDRPGAAAPAERVLATVLFTDVVDSTRRAEELGDAAWARLLTEHHAAVRRQLETWKGKEVKTTGDGFLATFASPARALQCARGIRDAVRRLGLEVRAGLHTGECEVSRDDVAGIAVHVAARVLGTAGPGEILVSSTVKDLVAGSGLRFSDQGRHQLKGIDGEWRLYGLTD